MTDRAWSLVYSPFVTASQEKELVYSFNPERGKCLHADRINLMAEFKDGCGLNLCNLQYIGHQLLGNSAVQH